MLIFTSILILSINIISAFAVEENQLAELIEIIPGILFCVLLCKFKSQRLVISKDILNNKIIIKELNMFCCSNKEIAMDIDNAFFVVRHSVSTDDDGTYEYNTLYISNNLKVNELDTSDIKQNPAILLYSAKLNDVRNGHEELTKQLNNSMGTSKNKNKKNYASLKSFQLNENFYTYYLKDPNGETCADSCCRIFWLCNIAPNIIIMAFIYIEERILFKALILFGLIIYNILVYMIYICFKITCDKIYRIDFIFSKDFDQLFIGFVKYNQKSYINTFEFQMNDINKFIFEIENNTNYYNLKVLFKNNENQQIHRFNRNEEELISFLNNKLVNVTTNY